MTRTFGLSFGGKHTSLGDRERDTQREIFSKVSAFWLALANNTKEYQVDLDKSDLLMFTEDMDFEGLVTKKIYKNIFYPSQLPGYGY